MAPHPRGASADARPTAPTPARPRLIARTRLLAFTVFAGLLLAGGLGGWFLASEVAAWPAPSHAVALAAVAAVSAGLAWRSTRRVEQLFEQEDQLLRSVVHEVRAPLSRLLLALDMGAAGLLAPATAVRDATGEAIGLQQLIDDLVEAARIMSGAIAVPTDAVRLDDVVRAAAAGLPVAPAVVEVATEPVTVVGSGRLVRLAVTNLVRNAAHHAYAGGPGTIRVRVDQQGISVADDGPGIDEARLRGLRRDLPQGLRRSGSGLGLALAAWVAEVHGGQLHLEGRPEGGFEVRLELPAASITDRP